MLRQFPKNDFNEKIFLLKLFFKVSELMFVKGYDNKKIERSLIAFLLSTNLKVKNGLKPKVL